MMSVRQRVSRIAAMTWSERFQKARARAVALLSPMRVLRRLAFRLDSYTARALDRQYVERVEAGPVNIDVKLARQANGGPFEPFEIVLINRAAAKLAAGAHRIVEVGCGTGVFATESVRRDPNVIVTASEMDARTLRWAQEHRAHPRITFCSASLDELAGGSFDLAVALEIIEHISDTGGSWGPCRLSPHGPSSPRRTRIGLRSTPSPQRLRSASTCASGRRGSSTGCCVPSGRRSTCTRSTGFIAR